MAIQTTNFFIIYSACLLFLSNSTPIFGDCPLNVQDPCKCENELNEPLRIYCEAATSLTHILSVLGPLKNSIESLTIADTSIPLLHKNAFSGYMLKRLSFIHNDLQTIDENAFDGELLESLEELEIRRNDLDSVPIVGLSRLRSLNLLSLAENSITLLDDNVFLHYESRKSLRTLDLSMNHIKTINDNAFLGLENIVTLLLDRNQIVKFPTEALLSIPSVEQIGLSVNKIKSIEEESLNLPALKSLSVEVNQIKLISRESFVGIPNLIYLYMGSNQLTYIDEEVFIHLTNLKVLALSNNPGIKELAPKSFKYMTNIIRLDLSQCSIKKIADSTFTHTPKVKVILLSGNQLSQISNRAFSSLKKIETIRLNNNQLSTIENGAFANLKTLKILDLSNNKLSVINSDIFGGSGLENISAKDNELLLYDNIWNCDKSFNNFRQWLRTNPQLIIEKSERNNEGIITKPARCYSPSTVKGLELRKISHSMLPPLVSEQTQKTIMEFKKLVKESGINTTTEESEITSNSEKSNIKVGTEIVTVAEEKTVSGTEMIQQTRANTMRPLHAFPNPKNLPKQSTLPSEKEKNTIFTETIRANSNNKRAGGVIVSADEFAHKKHDGSSVGGSFGPDISLYGNNFTLIPGFSTHNSKMFEDRKSGNNIEGRVDSEYANNGKQTFNPEGGYYLDRPWYWWF
uniref:LRRCT domain-containing protein n=1 Tax=Rhabditophanes sp. KR3021 TaxID=114890 RepID=A0AC35U6X4_9BILA